MEMLKKPYVSNGKKGYTATTTTATATTTTTTTITVAAAAALTYMIIAEI
jgi:hypothetical protein